MHQEARWKDTLHGLAMVDGGFIQDKARLALDPARTTALDPKMAALIVLGAAAASGSSSFCLRRSAFQALDVGASEEEIAKVLPVIAPVVGLVRIVSAAPDLAAAIGYDVEAALYDPDGP